MRVRRFELRLLAAVLSGLWATAAGLVLVAYRPGGPIDLLVGGVAALPLVVALVGLAWPPVARSDRAFRGLAWLGIGATLLLVPAIGAVLGQIMARGSQTLLPSAEAIYPWVLALAATSAFSGLGLARHVLGDRADRRRRLGSGLAFAGVATLTIATVFAGVASANELALRDRPSHASRFGPTAADLSLPSCRSTIQAGRTATIALDISGDADGRSLGGAQVAGERDGTDIRWEGQAATERLLGRVGMARIAGQAWALQPGTGWQEIAVSSTHGDLADRSVLEIALARAERVAAEDLGIEFVEGARARHCRTAVDGPTFLAAFPETAWIVGSDPLQRWRGEIDYWVFGDGELGQVAGFVNGGAGSIQPGAIQVTVRVHLTATDRDQSVAIAPPR